MQTITKGLKMNSKRYNDTLLDISPPSWTITIPDWHPTKLNKLLNSHWFVANRYKKQDYSMIWVYANKAQIPPAKGKRKVDLNIVLGKGERAADVDAWWKSVLDSLVHNELLVNDSPKWCEISSVTYERGKKATIIKLTEMGA